MKRQPRLILSLLSAALIAYPIGMLWSQGVSEAELGKQLLDLSASNRFDEAQELALRYLREEPDAGELLYGFVKDLVENHDQFERAIAIIDKTLPALEEADPNWGARVVEERGIAIVFGRYKQTADKNDLAEAKSDFQHSVQLEPSMSEAHFHLGVINAIEGDVAESKASFQKAIETSANPDITAAMREWVAMAEQNPQEFCRMMRTFYSTSNQ